ncbi:MAG: MmgE/PrpD family protein [Alcaligenaceae bacterium]
MTQSNAPQTILEQIAERIVSFDLKAITPQAIMLSRTAIIDTLGVTLAGAIEPCTTNLLRTPGVASAPGICTIFGTSQKTSALDATFINGTASHALDYDDFSQPMGGHQSAPLVAPLMAIAEERGASGLQLIQSYVVGIETEIRLARAVNFYHYDKGWHPTATLGVFGAAAAAGHLLGLSAKKQAIALAIAASFASGIKANFGTMVKPLHVGQSARNGLLAALMADAGYDANPEALEHHQGFFNAFNGKGNYDAKLIFENWANPLEVLSPSMGLKQFACCGSTHPAVTMALQLRQEETFSPQDIEKVDILPHRRRLPHTNNPDPQTPLAAKFSVQYAVATAY